MKRSRRKKHQVPVSFFAFQDIITALAGTLLIIVLVSAYGRSRSGSADTEMVSRADFDLQQKKLQLKEEQLAAKQQELARLRKARKRSSLREQKAQQSIRYKNAASELNDSLAEWELLHGKLTAELQKLNAELEDCTPEMRSLLAQAGEVDRLKTELKHRQNSFKLAQSGKLQLVILDCARGRWLWSDPQSKAQPLGAGDPSPQSALNELRRRLRSMDTASVKLVIAVRPSAGYFAQALKELLQWEFPDMQIISEPLASETLGGFEL